MSPLRKMVAWNDDWSLFPHCFNSVMASVTHCTGKAIVFPNVLMIHFFKFLQKLAINNSLSLFVNKNESANSTTVVNIFSITITHRELDRVHSCVQRCERAELRVVLAGKDCRAALVREAADSMLDIPAWPVRRKITQDWKSFSHSKWCTKLQGEKNSFCLEKQPKYLSTSPGTSVSVQNSQCFKCNNVTIPAKSPAYFRRVSCGSGEKSPLHFVLWLKLFSSNKPSANDPDKYGEQLACMYVSCKKTRGDSWSCCSVIGQKKTKVFWHQSEARTTPTVWNWSFKTLSPGALLVVLDFSSPEFFCRPLWLFPAPTNCPWVSEDGVKCFLKLTADQALVFRWDRGLMSG